MGNSKRGFAKLTPIKDAVELIVNKFNYNPVMEEINTLNGNKRILAEDIISAINLPGFRRSAMDGYAVRSNDTFGASETSPINLPINGMVEIGDTNTPEHQPLTAIKISTGAPLPEGADAVVKLEDCEELENGSLNVYGPVAFNKNVSNEDEDVGINDLVFKKNHVLRPWDLALLISLGRVDLKVWKKPRISTLSTGSELVDRNQLPEKGEVIDSNRPTFNILLEEFNVVIDQSFRCEDEYEIIKENLKKLAESSDLIISSGGTSVGTKDYLPGIIHEIGELWVHGVAIRPGKPVALGVIRTNTSQTPIISLPGYPLSAFINFELLVGPVLEKWTNVKKSRVPVVKTTLLQKIPSVSGLRDFVRLRKEENGASLIRITGAGILSSLVNADYMLEIPEDVEGYPAGSEVMVKELK